MRKAVQIFFLTLFTLLFFLTVYPLRIAIPVDLFLRFDPLIAVTSSIASHTIYTPLLLSLILLIATFFFGRFFCGYVCPFGTVIDFSEKIFPENKRKNLSVTKKAYTLKNVKYYILLFILLCAVAGFNLAYFFDPISLLTRVYTLILYPLTMLVFNAVLNGIRPVAEHFNWIIIAHKQFMEPVFSMNLVILFLFLSILALSYFSNRFWCRNLCPLGALLSLISPLSLFKRQVSEDCNTCMKCYHNCTMGAILTEPKDIHPGECIECLECAAICPQSAVSFKGPGRLSFRNANFRFDLSRRGLLCSLGAGVFLSLGLKTSPFEKISSKRLIRPPGALPEKTFLKRCVRCSECMKVCITNTLQPCLWESGLAGLWTPKVFPRLAGCDQTCNLCGMVCPTGAIRSLPIEEKKYAKLGTAFIDRQRCLVWEQDRLCLICDEQCPYNAIVFQWQEGLRRPFIVEHKCNGCGFCEEHCPVEGESAIIVTPHDQIRLLEGSYRETAQRYNLQFKETPGDDSFLIEQQKVKETPLQKREKNRQYKRKVPRGFILK